jgi:transcriptional regulator with XRE-family HTH domain
MRELSPKEKRKCLGRVLRRERDKTGLSQRKFAPLLQQPQSYVSKYERGERRLDIVEVDEISGVTGATLTGLVRRYQREVKTEAAAAPKPAAKTGKVHGGQKPAKGKIQLRW